MAWGDRDFMGPPIWRAGAGWELVAWRRQAFAAAIRIAYTWDMAAAIRASYENGHFRPLDPVALSENDIVSIVVTTSGQSSAPPNDAVGSSGSSQDDDFDAELDGLLFNGPGLPVDFSRAEFYANLG
jgi:predicted DNA-binding antitoxin AbrB/MazE fold protein